MYISYIKENENKKLNIIYKDLKIVNEENNIVIQEQTYYRNVILNSNPVVGIGSYPVSTVNIRKI
jgi:hypothetical protein